MSEQSRNEREYRAAEFARHFLDDNDFAFLETAPKHDRLLKSIEKGEFEFIFSPFIPKQEIMENISSKFYQISSLIVFLIPLAYLVSVVLFFCVFMAVASVAHFGSLDCSFAGYFAVSIGITQNSISIRNRLSHSFGKRIHWY